MKIQDLLRLIFLGIAAISIASCGGSKGGNNNGPGGNDNAPDEETEQTALKISSLTNLSGSAGETVSQNFKIEGSGVSCNENLTAETSNDSLAPKSSVSFSGKDLDCKISVLLENPGLTAQVTVTLKRKEQNVTASFEISSDEAPPTTFVLGQNSMSDRVQVRKNFTSPKNTVYAGGKFYLIESGRKRVLGWNSFPTKNGQEPDFALGQNSLSENFAPDDLNSTSFNSGLAIASDGTKFVLADRSNYRILIWNSLPTSNSDKPDVVVGQDDFTTRTSGLSATKMNQPMGVWIHAGKLIVADGNNHRVLIWNSIPTTNGAAADVVLGQSDFTSNTSGTSSTKLNAPVDVEVGDDKLFVVDASNNRVMIWNTIPTDMSGAPYSAQVAIGQIDITSNTGAVTQSGLSSPSGIAYDSDLDHLYVSSNARVLRYDSIPTDMTGAPYSANLVVGRNSYTDSSGIAFTQSSTMGPAGVTVKNGKLIICDSSYSRVMIWNSIPSADNAPADIVLGKSSFTSADNYNDEEQSNNFVSPSVSIAGNRLLVTNPFGSISKISVWNKLPEKGYVSPDYGIGVVSLDSSEIPSDDSKALLRAHHSMFDGSRLIVAEYSGNRVAIWNTLPTSTGVPPDVLVGQTDHTSTTNGTSQTKIKQPRHAFSDGTKLFVADSGNNRVLVWNAIPSVSNSPASFVLGQPDSDFASSTANNGGISASSMSSPRYVAVHDGKLYVVDTLNNRVLVWNSVPTSTTPADFVIGQSGFNTGAINASLPSVNAKGFAYPTHIAFNGGSIYLSDWSNSRILGYKSLSPAEGQDADFVIGQPDFDTIQTVNALSAEVFRPAAVAFKGDQMLIGDGEYDRIIVRKIEN